MKVRGPRPLKRRDEAELDAIVATCEDSHRNRPPVIYHYTTWHGFRGIVTQQRLRATRHALIRDDRNELASADQVILRVAADLRAERSGRAARALDTFLETYHQLHLSKMASVYLSCFSKTPDKAELWEKFARQGICLGIKMLDGEHRPDTSGVGTALMRVEYNEEACRAELVQRFNATLNTRVKDPDLLAANLFRVVAFSVISYKPLHFDFEEEWRLVCLAEDTTPKDYLEMPMRDGKLAVFTEVILGPGQAEGNTIGAAEEVLRAAGYTADIMPTIRMSQLEPAVTGADRLIAAAWK